MPSAHLTLRLVEVPHHIEHVEQPQGGGRRHLKPIHYLLKHPQQKYA